MFLLCGVARGWSFHLLPVCVRSHFSCVWLFAMLWTVAISWDSPGKNTGVGCRTLLAPSSRESSQTRDQTWVSYIYPHWQAVSSPLAPPGKPSVSPSYILHQLWELRTTAVLQVCPYPKHAHFHHQTEVSLPSERHLLSLDLISYQCQYTDWLMKRKFKEVPLTFPLQKVSKILIYERSNSSTSRSGYVGSVEENFWCGYSFESVFCLRLLSGDDSMFGAQEVGDIGGDWDVEKHEILARRSYLRNL